MIRLFATAIGGFLLGLSFLIPHWGGLVFLALVPLFLHMPTQSARRVYWQGLVMGFTAFAVANYWIYLFLHNLSNSSWLPVALSAVYFFFGANAIALLFMLLCVLRRQLPFILFSLCAPFLAPAFLHFYPLLFELNLAQTLVHYPLLIAPAALTGQWLLVALIVFVNLLIAEWLMAISKKINNSRSLSQNSPAGTKLSRLSAGLLLASLFWITLGWVCTKEIANTESTPLKLGIVQTDDMPGVATVAAIPGHTLAYPEEMSWAYSLAKQGAQVIVWPESRPKGILSHEWVREAHQTHAQLMNVDLIIQDLARSESSQEAYLNKSVLFGRDGRTAEYQKTRPIPFGEAIPGPFNFEPVKTWITHIFRGIYKPIIPGDGSVLFQVGEHTVLPLICYEIFDRQRIAKTITSHPEINLIVLQSNDRWFFSRHQVNMHNAVAQLRAVESSRPVLHVVNGGPSFFIDAHGKVTATTDYRRAGAYLLEAKLPLFPDH